MTPTTHVTGDSLAVSDWNTVANNETFLYQAPYGMYYNSVVTSLTSGPLVQISLGGTIASGYGFSCPSNIAIPPIAGVYQTCFAAQAATTSGIINAVLCVNGSEYASGAYSAASASLGAQSSGSAVVKWSSGAGFSLWGLNTGSTANSGNLAFQTYLHAFYVGST
jgi:hypothetical protein